MVLKKTATFIDTVKSQKFTFIQQHLGEYQLGIMCRVLQVTPSGFYSWQQRPISKHKLEDNTLKPIILSIYKKHHGRYGAPRIQAELTKMGRCHSIKRIARLMKDLNL